ncbi:MAG: class I SAM-dependent methyltransferase [Flavobacteriales bacterium]|nr:class I SAM-dependent methyltransferase [Flavobacteriales bacterium]
MSFKRYTDPDLKQFIVDSLNIDLTKLILKGSPFEDVSIKEIANQVEAKNKSKSKLPTWYANDDIIYPSKLSIEQTSSEATAKYKSSLFSGKKAIDLTGGFGIDAYYFSENYKEFTHCEYNKELSEIVKHNFSVLGKNNVKFISGDGLDYIKSSSEKYDLIYLDPARRSDAKGKVFLLVDTQPNPVENIDLLLSRSDNILIKVSPLLDLNNTVRELKNVKTIYIVSVNNEVKELLIHLEKLFISDPEIHSIDINSKGEISENIFSLYDSTFDIEFSRALKYLYEPSSAIMKSGAFRQISNKYNLYKIAQNSHLYTSDNLLEDFPGRTFEIITVTKPGKKEIKSILKSNKANVSTRNYPMSVADIRKKFKIKDGGDDYLFFTTDSTNQTILIHARKNV